MLKSESISTDKKKCNKLFHYGKVLPVIYRHDTKYSEKNLHAKFENNAGLIFYRTKVIYNRKPSKHNFNICFLWTKQRKY